MADLGDQNLRAIGRMVVACSRVEGMGRPILAAAMGLTKEAAQAEFGGRGHGWVLKTLRRTIKLRVDDPDLRDAWVAWVQAAKLLTKRRNRLVHMQWIDPGVYGTAALVGVTADGWPEEDPLELASSNSVMALADAADDLSRRLSNLVRQTPGLRS